MKLLLNIILLLFILSYVNICDGINHRRKSRHKHHKKSHHHYKKHKSRMFPPLMGMPPPPITAMPGLSPFTPPIGGPPPPPNAAGTSSVGNTFRFQQVKSKRSSKDRSNLQTQIYNVLATRRDSVNEAKNTLKQQEKMNSLQKNELKAKEAALRAQQKVLARLEYCLSTQGKKNTTAIASAATKAVADAGAKAVETMKNIASQTADLQRKKLELDQQAKDLLVQRTQLNERVKRQQALEVNLQKKLNMINQQILKRMNASTNSLNSSVNIQKVVKYVKVPQVIYKPAPSGCEAVESCGKCVANPTCGWCDATSKCITAINGTTAKCDADTWSYNFCKAYACKDHLFCHSCMADPRCGRCGSNCVAGSLSGPTSGTCAAWNYATDLRFLSYNIYGRDMRNVTGRAAWLFKMISESDADFIALQEVEDWFLEALANQKWANNYHLSDYGSGHAPGGLLFMSKLPLDSVSYYEKTDPGQVEVDQRARMLTVRPKMGSTQLVLATTTLDWRNSMNRVAALDFISSVLNTSSDAVLMGDFNFDEGAEPETSRVPTSYHDVWKTVHSTQKGYTWDPEENSYARESDPTSRPSRIDRMFVKSGFWTASKIDKIGCAEASPHYGLLAEFSMFGAYC